MAIRYDEWQTGLAQLILGRDEDDRYCSTVGGVTLSVARQVGKTFTIGSLLVALCLEYPGLRVVWTSHHLRTTTNTFRAMQRMVRRKRIWPHVEQPNGIRTANGEQEIRFAKGSIIMFGAREHGFGVGIDAIDILVCDEAQRLTSTALADMVPTTNQAQHPHGALLFFIGTPPRPTNQGDEFAARRRKALAGTLTNGVFVEISADEDGDYSDPAQWEKANPSYPHRTPHESMLRLRENLTDEGDWRREAMGVWDLEVEESGPSSLITMEMWADTAVERAPDGCRSIAIVFDFDGARQAVAGAVKHDDGVHVELIDQHSGSSALGTASLVRWLTSDPDRPERWRSLAEIAIAGGGEAGALLAALRDAGVPSQMLRRMSTQDVLAANAMLLDSVRDQTLTHPAGDETDALTASALGCDQRTRTGGWSWRAITKDDDQLPIEAASMALWMAKTTKRRPVGAAKARGRGAGRRTAGRR